MPSCKRSFILSVILGAFVGASVTPASAQDQDRRRVRHSVKQANLYLKMNLAVRARELLTKTVAQEPGRSDPLAWLALGRAYFSERRIDEAGRAVRRARRLGVKDVVGRSKWAKAFLEEYRSHVGALVIDGGACQQLQLPAKLAAPMVNVTRRALLDSARGWRTGTLTRERGKRFYLPAGRYRFGGVKVNVLPAELVRLNASDVGAQCAPPPGLAKAAAEVPPPGGAVIEPTTVAATEEESSWFEDNWVWLVVGAVVVAGGTGTAVALTSGGGPDQVNFNPNPSSIRGQ